MSNCSVEYMQVYTRIAEDRGADNDVFLFLLIKMMLMIDWLLIIVSRMKRKCRRHIGLLIMVTAYLPKLED